MESKYFRGLAVAAGLAVAGFACADGIVTGVTASRLGAGVRIVIKGDELSKPAMVSTFGGTRLILDFAGQLEGRAKKVDVWLGGVSTVNYAQNTADRVRIVLRVTSDETPKLTQVEGGWAVTFGTGDIIAPTKRHTSGDGFPETVGALEPVAIPKTLGVTLTPNSQLESRSESGTPAIKPVARLEPKDLKAHSGHRRLKAKLQRVDDTIFPTEVGPLESVTIPERKATIEPMPPIRTETVQENHSATLKTATVPPAPTITTVTTLVEPSVQKQQIIATHSDALASKAITVTLEAKPTTSTEAPKVATADNLTTAVGKRQSTIADHQLSEIEIAKIKSTIQPATDAVVQLTTGKNYPTSIGPKTTVSAKANGYSTRTGVLVSDPGPMVSLDFVNTEVAQIVKALALQSGANIVLAPEVSKLHQVTVTLNQVPLTEALDLVTTVSGLKYSKIGSSYVITGSNNFNYVQKQLGGHRDGMLETRVIPIYSGNAKELKGAVTSAISQLDDHSEYEMILPGEPGGLVKQVKRTDSQAPASGGAAGGASGGADQASTGGAAATGGGAADQTGATPPAGGQAGSADQSGGAGATAGAGAQPTELRGTKSQFIVLVGPSSGIDQIEGMIKDTDARFCQAKGVEAGGDPTIVRSTYPIQSHDMTASQLALALKPGISNMDFKVDLYWPPDTFPNQVMIVEGRRNEVNKVLELLQTLDKSGYGDDTQIYEVKFSDPRALREDVMSQVPGLRASLVPASAGNPRIYVPGSYSGSKSQVTTNAQQQGSTGGGTTGGAGGTTSSQGPAQGGSQSKAVKGDVGQVEGLQQPFNDFESDSQPMKLVLHGTPDQIVKADKYLALVDVTPRQVALEMRVMELSREDALNFGIDWSILTGGTVKTINLNQSLLNPGGNSIGAHIGGRKWSANVTATLDSIANKNNLIARPNLLALDGRETEIFIGDIIRYVTSIQSTQQGTTVTTASLPVGVRLAVLPRIGGDGTLTMDLRPVVSFLKSFTAVPGGGQLPQTSVRISQSTVNIKDGETIAIGGLIQDQDVKQSSKVPILGDLPFIGQLFRKVQNDRQRSEVVFFLTAKVVDPADRKNAANPEENAKKNPPEIKQGKG